MSIRMPRFRTAKRSINMKKIHALFALVLLLTVSCADDDHNNPVVYPTVNGALTVNGVTKNINKGYVIKPYTGTDPNYDQRRFYVILSDGDVTLFNNDLVFSDNTHQLIDFNLYTHEDAAGSVQNATYNLYIPKTGFDMGNAFIDHTNISTNLVLQNGQVVSGDGLDSDDMDAGQLTLAHTDGVYTLAFSFSNDGNTVSGNFTGTLTELIYEY